MIDNQWNDKQLIKEEEVQILISIIWEGYKQKNISSNLYCDSIIGMNTPE